MAQPILVPQVGQDLTEAKIIELHVKLGDRVKKGDLVAVVESEKASFEVEAFCEGVVISLPFKAGDMATVLEPMMHLGQEGETLAALREVVDPLGLLLGRAMG
ncbi:MAG: biotin/lipoyl-containing protein, partial [Alphaproteobacteria bacterium]